MILRDFSKYSRIKSLHAPVVADKTYKFHSQYLKYYETKFLIPLASFIAGYSSKLELFDIQNKRVISWICFSIIATLPLIYQNSHFQTNSRYP